MITRRQLGALVPAFAPALAPALVASPLVLAGCSSQASESYESAANRIWQPGAPADFSGDALSRELVRYATLAPSSHNTQCWKFAIGADKRSITVLPDLARQCPAVDPDLHHVYVSLGCATENLAQAALAHGRLAQAQFQPGTDDVRIQLDNTSAEATALFQAVPLRQCTRGEYDGKPLRNEELALLQHAGSSGGVRMLLLTDRAAMEQTLEFVIRGNTAQLADPAFMKELQSWIRFNGADAVRTGDGLYSVSSGSPNFPSWIGDLAFRWILRPQSDADKYARQVRSSAGIAVFVGQAADKASWVEVGRCYERFALQATVLGVRNAFLNQPVEVAQVRPPFASALGLGDQRPDLVVRFGRGPALPRSLRRPVASVLM